MERTPAQQAYRRAGSVYLARHGIEGVGKLLAVVEETAKGSSTVLEMGATRALEGQDPWPPEPEPEPVDTRPVVVQASELTELLAEADAALDGDSNDAEHDALYSLRVSLAEWIEQPQRRYHDDEPDYRQEAQHDDHA